MFGYEKPVGVQSRLLVIDPAGNCIEGEASRRAAATYAHALIELGTHHGDKRYVERGEQIRDWIEQETIAAETVRVMGEMNQ